ncbi:DtxR family transcriptional regulator [Thermoclostridium stercorarium subsp. thermolacticum DSM 2910]|jgi:DtxR family Mn-dependent transcriptional regulator|uniref:Manganese transport regulator n=2 Tax=Thermoclostridium stercorarium TaxID=1510 RepID=A0A1B1YM81_THEST|nr:iron dependent repressor, metal binding and dimerization domain protein [Thermoclostridium stercorarium]ANW99269.1 DtxR family transcriptional regulator [Thermoclostridium stercorarium subsp. thermolacticum DSM 2910]ANX01897.1 DtxR family transcriptional regulator [Thermoclostridium stercorarium subsp. leptospartum DSM 9219]UZQ84942.1 DtxR family transcriptional regulator [Thermoclostridium stercorarium]
MSKDNGFHTVRGYQLLNQENKLLTSGMEDYLEMIYRNMETEGYIRINTLSKLLNVRPSSATKMVQKLAKLGLVDYRKYDIIILTEAGKKYGKFLLERHKVIERFLRNIGITENILAETELIEHNIGLNTMKNIDMLNMFFEKNPDILEKFKRFIEARQDSEKDGNSGKTD